MTDRTRLHSLVDELPESELSPAVRFLEFLGQQRDPVRTAHFTAPLDDEPLTEEDLAALEEGLEDWRQGKAVDHATVRRRLLGVA